MGATDIREFLLRKGPNSHFPEIQHKTEIFEPISSLGKSWGQKPSSICLHLVNLFTGYGWIWIRFSKLKFLSQSHWERAGDKNHHKYVYI